MSDFRGRRPGDRRPYGASAESRPPDTLAQQLRRQRENARRLTYLTTLRLLAWLPTPWSYALARQLGRLRFRLESDRVARLTEYVQERLRVSPEEARGWLRSTYELIAYEDLDVWRLERITLETLEQVITIDGYEHLEAALAKGTGAILYGAHVRGMYPLFVALGLRGHPVSVLVRNKPVIGGTSVDGKFFARRVRQFERAGNEFIETYPPDPFLAARCTRILRQNRIILVSIDARAAQADDVELEFLNEIKPFSIGPAMMAKASGAPLLEYSVQRSSASAPAIGRIGTPLAPSDDLVAVTRALAHQVEATIRGNPASWNLWFDRINQRRVMRWLAQFVPSEDRTTLMANVRNVKAGDVTTQPDRQRQ